MCSTTDQVGQHGGDDLFFLRTAFGDHQGHGDQGIVGNPFIPVFVIEQLVFVGEAQEYGGGNPFVAIDKAVVFDEEIEQVRSLFLNGRIDVFPVEALHDGIERAMQAFILFLAEYRRVAEFLAHSVDQFHGFFVADRFCLAPRHLADGHPLVVVVIEQVQGRRILGNGLKQDGGFVTGERFAR